MCASGGVLTMYLLCMGSVYKHDRGALLLFFIGEIWTLASVTAYVQSVPLLAMMLLLCRFVGGLINTGWFYYCSVYSPCAREPTTT